MFIAPKLSSQLLAPEELNVDSYHTALLKELSIWVRQTSSINIAPPSGAKMNQRII